MDNCVVRRDKSILNWYLSSFMIFLFFIALKLFNNEFDYTQRCLQCVQHIIKVTASKGLQDMVPGQKCKVINSGVVCTETTVVQWHAVKPIQMTWHTRMLSTLTQGHLFFCFFYQFLHFSVIKSGFSLVMTTSTDHMNKCKHWEKQKK